MSRDMEHDLELAHAVANDPRIAELAQLRAHHVRAIDQLDQQLTLRALELRDQVRRDR